jgi:hypothetical protein
MRSTLCTETPAAGVDAQSSGKLYVRLDKGLSYVLYGDYTTATPIRRDR